jgi:hypothetical protein
VNILKALLITGVFGAIGYFATPDNETPMFDGWVMVALSAVFIASTVYLFAKESK